MSSDVYAWDATMNLTSGFRNREFPRSTLRWGMALTSNSQQDFKVAPAGLALYLDVKVGSLWAVIGKRYRDFGQLGFPHGPPWNPSEVPTQLEACYLPEGIRMYVAFPRGLLHLLI